jgi:hypothetical protein
MLSHNLDADRSGRLGLQYPEFYFKGVSVAQPMDVETAVIMFAKIGEALWHTQNVERVLHTYIAFKDRIKERNAVSEAEAEAIIESIARMTLGGVIKLSKNAAVLSAPLQERITAFNAERRWLVHWSVVEKGDSLIIDESHWIFMERIAQYVAEAQYLHRAIASEFEDFTVSKGVSRKGIDKEFQRRLRVLRGELA